MKPLQTICFLLLISLITVGCKKKTLYPQPEQIQSPTSINRASISPDRVTPRIEVLLQALKDEEDSNPECRQLRSPGLYPNEVFTLPSLAIQQDCLSLNLAYSGGCKQHLFALTWNKRWNNTAKSEVTLKLHHYANGDLCEAWITEEKSWDIYSLRSPDRNVQAVVINVETGFSPALSITYQY